jgi:hypothetical protein
MRLIHSTDSETYRFDLISAGVTHQFMNIYHETSKQP